MQVKTLKNLEYFIGKICSIFTSPINREFDEFRSREHFVVRILDVTSDGIWTEHPHSETKSFFFLPHILFIQEELTLDPNNPEHAEMIKEYENKTGKKVEGDLKKKVELPILEEAPPVSEGGGDSAFIDIASLHKLASETKRNFDRFK